MKTVENSYALASSVRDLNCRGIHLRWSFSLSLFDQRGSSAESKLYLDLSDSRPELVAPGKEAVQPASLPWLAVVVLPFIVNQTREDVSWLGDFERCMAWTILTPYGPQL